MGMLVINTFTIPSIFMNLSERLKTWHCFQEFHPSREVYPRKICSEQGLELVLALNRKSHTQLL